MTSDEVRTTIANRSLCFSCLAGITAALERDALVALFACNIEIDSRHPRGLRTRHPDDVSLPGTTHDNRCGVITSA